MLVASLVVGTGLLVVSAVDAVAQSHVDSARVCAPDEEFTGADCRVTLDGAVVNRSHTEVTIDVEDRRITMPVGTHADPYLPEPIPVRVTFYRGQPIRLEGSGLEADESYGSDARGFLCLGLVLLVVGGAIGGILLVAHARNE
jgi:hypothetical protein